MSITTYAELLTAAQNWLARSDSDIQARIPELITLTEDAITWGVEDPELPIPRLRARQMEARVTYDVSTQYTTLASFATDVLEIREIRLNSDPVVKLEYMAPDAFDRRWVSSMTGQPLAFTIIGGEIQVGPSPDTAYETELRYYQKIPALTVSNTTNWLLTAAPGIYLYGVMYHAVPYVQAAGVDVDADLLTDTMYWYRQFAGRVNGLNKSSEASKYAGALYSRPGVSVV